MFSELGNSWSLDDNMMSHLEEYMCLLYGKGLKNINTVRYEKFTDVYKKKNKIQDLSLLSPCQQSIKDQISS